MAIDDKVQVKLSYLINFDGTFENLRIEIGTDRFLEKDETYNEAIDKDYEYLLEQLMERVETIKQEMKPKKRRRRR